MNAEFLAIVPFLLGLLQKHVFTQLPNDAIPWINVGVCLLLASFVTGGDAAASIDLAAKWAGTAAIGHAGLKGVIKKLSAKSI